MWLLNVYTRRLERFAENKKPPYAILSHRWGADEITFEDVQRGRAAAKPGYHKIELCCKQTIRDRKDWEQAALIRFSYAERMSYIWADICCIDTSSSAELSEAINSMYRWYQEAAVCYAYLPDVLSRNHYDIVHSDWFTRGWTLQELLAPNKVHFYDKSWGYMGDRHTLAPLLAELTGIPQTALKDFVPGQWSIADKMSWAAQRKTTREEDRAYSLLGLFGVNMPLIYGEGTRAFYRLQEEILRISDDLTFFAWTVADAATIGMLAESPAAFGHRRKRLQALNIRDHPGLKLRQQNDDLLVDDLTGSSMFSFGLSASLYLVPHFYHVYFVPLCLMSDSTDTMHSVVMGMVLARRDGDGFFLRISNQGQCLFPGPADWWSIAKPRTIVIAREPLVTESAGYRFSQPGARYGFEVRTIELGSAATACARLYSREGGTRPNELVMSSGSFGIAGMIRLSIPTRPLLYFLFGFDHDFNLLCLVVNPDSSSEGPQPPSRSVFSNASLALEGLVLGSNKDMMRLIARLQVRRIEGHACTLPRDGVELHVVPWKKSKADFTITDTGRVGFERDRRTIHIDVDADNAAARSVHVTGPCQEIQPWVATDWSIHYSDGLWPQGIRAHSKQSIEAEAAPSEPSESSDAGSEETETDEGTSEAGQTCLSDRPAST